MTELLILAVFPIVAAIIFFSRLIRFFRKDSQRGVEEKRSLILSGIILAVIIAAQAFLILAFQAVMASM